MANPARRRTRYGIGLIAIGLLAYAAVFGLEHLVNPWSLSFPGHPALVGYWSGTMTFGPGDDRDVAIHMWRYDPGGGGGVPSGEAPDLVGRARICGPTDASTYEVTGKALNFMGTRFTVGLRVDSVQAGKNPEALNGTWDGADLIRVRTGLHTVGSDGVAGGEASTDARTGDVDVKDGDIRFELRRSDKEAFGSACN
jgi:hypothetical protein